MPLSGLKIWNVIKTETDKQREFDKKIQERGNKSDYTGGNKMKIDKLMQLWEEFSEIPINNDDCIEVNFYLWEKGTYRFDIWHWFDEKLPNGIAQWVSKEIKLADSIWKKLSARRLNRSK